MSKRYLIRLCYGGEGSTVAKGRGHSIETNWTILFPYEHDLTAGLLNFLYVGMATVFLKGSSEASYFGKDSGCYISNKNTGVVLV